MTGSIKSKDNVNLVLQSLDYLDLTALTHTIREEMVKHPNDDVLATLALNMATFSEERHNKTVARLLNASKLRHTCSFDDLLKYPERQLDLEFINDISELHFVRNHENLIIWGSPGTGKTWLAEAIVTAACQHHIRSRWISFPMLYRELENKYKDQQVNKMQHALDSRLNYYAKIPLLCIDEFPNCKMKDVFLVQEFFDERCSLDNSTIICSQASPENWPDLFEVTSFGQSIRGRIEQKGKVLELKGPDLRLFKPAD